MTDRPEDVLIAIVSLAVAGWIVWTIRRGLAQGRMPVGRGWVERTERPGAYNALLGSYAVAIVLLAFIAIDLLFAIGS